MSTVLRAGITEAKTLRIANGAQPMYFQYDLPGSQDIGMGGQQSFNLGNHLLFSPPGTYNDKKPYSRMNFPLEKRYQVVALMRHSSRISEYHRELRGLF